MRDHDHLGDHAGAELEHLEHLRRRARRAAMPASCHLEPAPTTTDAASHRAEHLEPPASSSR